jgi:hypothetical protein
MLGRKPVVDAQHPRAGHVGNAPGKIAKQRRKAEQIGAAVQVQDVSVWKLLPMSRKTDCCFL